MSSPFPYTGNFKFTAPGVDKLEYRILIAEATTGKIWTELPFIGIPSWSDFLALGQSGSMKVKCPLSDPRAAKDDRSLLRLMRGIASGPWRYVFILMLNGQPLFGGPLLGHNVSKTEAAIEFHIASVNALSDKRIAARFNRLTNPRGWDADLRYLSPTKISWIAIQLVISMISTPNSDIDPEGYARRALPFIADNSIWQNQPIGTETREYKAIDLGTVYEALKKLTETDDGPDIYFKPWVGYNETQFYWEIKVGDPYVGQMDYPWTWDYGVNCLAVGEDSDASKMTSRTYVPGDGQDEGKLIGYAQDLRLVQEGFPSLETVANSNGQEGRNQRAIDKAAAGYQAAYRNSSIKWSIDVDPHQWPQVTDYTMGDTFRLNMADHHWIEDGEYQHRIIGIEGNSSNISLLTNEFQKGSNIAARAY